MVDVVSNKCECGKSQPCFNIPGKKPKYCKSCRNEDMVNVISSKTCKNKLCDTVINITSKKYDNYCLFCYVNLYPDKPIIEIDENQHKAYDTMCEIGRMNELFTDFSDRPIIFIRFNPDGYIMKKYHHPNKINSVTGLQYIGNIKAWNQRLKYLEQK